MKRHNVNKTRAARKFRGASAKTKSANMAPPPMRGGYRL